MKKCCISLIIREIQVETTMRYACEEWLLPNTRNTCCQGRGEKKTLVHCWWECKLVQTLWKTVWSFPPKLKIQLPYPAIPRLGIYLKKIKILTWKDIYILMFITALFTKAQIWKQSKCSLPGWMDKSYGICCIYNRIFLSQWNLATCDNMDGLCEYCSHVANIRPVGWIRPSTLFYPAAARSSLPLAPS